MRWIVAFFLIIATIVLARALLTFDPSHLPAEIKFASSDVFTLDPQRMSYMQDLRISRSLFDGLCSRDSHTGFPTPAVATSWETSPDAKTWTFHLRPDARWTNGDPVTSMDFRNAWRRLLLPHTAADYSELLFPIRGSREFFAWRTNALAQYAAGKNHDAQSAKALWDSTLAVFDQMVGIRTPDPQTLIV